MSRRVTVMIEDDLHEKLKKYQNKKISQTHEACSFSKAINEVLRKGLKIL